MFSNGISIFEILLDNPTATYTPGEKVSGKLIIQLNRRKSLRALKLRFIGECKIHWTESRGIGSDSETDHYNGTEQYFRYEVCLYGSDDGNTVEMVPIHYVFPFSYTLPRNIPGSFEHHIGKIHYSIEAIFDRQWKLDHRVIKFITINAPLEWEPLEQHQEMEIDDEIVKSFCCCLLPCINVGKMLVRIRIPNTVFECGDNIEATINVNNKSNTVDVTKIKFKLEHKLDFHSQSPKKKRSDIDTIRKVEELGPFPKDTEVKLRLRVPTIQSTFFKYCKLIDLKYRLHISIRFSGCHCATKKIYNIVIGSRSMMPSISHQPSSALPMANYSTPSTSRIPRATNSTATELFPKNLIISNNPPYPPPIFPATGGLPYPSGNIHQPPQDIGFVRPHPSSHYDNRNELPPPSYSDAMSASHKKF